YFLIGVWGGPRREYAAIKFFLYTLLGSVFILIALLAFYFTNVRDFLTIDRLAERVSAQGQKAFEAADKPPASGQKEFNTFEDAKRAESDARQDVKVRDRTAEDAARALADAKQKMADAEAALAGAADDKKADLKQQRDDARAAQNKVQVENDAAAKDRD